MTLDPFNEARGKLPEGWILEPMPIRLTPKRWIVLGFEHPALGTREIGRYRFKTVATLRAWVFRTFEGALLWPDAWVDDGR